MKGLIIVLLSLGFYCKSNKTPISNLNIQKMASDSVRIEFEINYPDLDYITTSLGHDDSLGCNHKVFNFNYAANNLGEKKLCGATAKILVEKNKYSFVVKNDFGGEVNFLVVQVGDNKGNLSKRVYYKNSESLEQMCEKILRTNSH